MSFKPSGDEVARVAEFLLDEIDLSLMSGDNELDFGDSTGVRTVSRGERRRRRAARSRPRAGRRSPPRVSSR
ncbi:hypothetical protein ACU4GD_27830 [Cupriavidus basilensis]